MRCLATRIPAAGLALAVGGLLITAAPATAAELHPVVASSILGDIFGAIGHAVVGAISWTFSLASKFFLVTLGALVKLLIPRSWAQQGVALMDWIVQIPNYAGTIRSPQGHMHGFAGINELRDLFTWLGVAIGPLTLAVATGRAIVSEREHPAAPIIRMITLAGLLVSYPYWWAQGSALVDQITHTILSLPAVTDGIHKLMLYAVDGVALGGWQLIDLSLMLAIGLELLALIVLKVGIILLGALLYAIGPLMLGLAPLQSGAAITRAWATAAATLIALPVLWAAIFAVGALLIDDAGTAGPLLAGNTSVGHLVGGLLLAVAGLAALHACLRIAREAGGLLRLQLGGMLAGVGPMRAGPARTSLGISRSQAAAPSLRDFGQRASRGAGNSGHAAAGTGPRGSRAARIGGLALTVGRRGIVGSAALAGAAGARHVAAYTGGPRAGVVAMQMARAGHSYRSSSATPAPSSRAAARTAAPSSPAGTGRNTPHDARNTPVGAPTVSPPAGDRAAASGAGRRGGNTHVGRPAGSSPAPPSRVPGRGNAFRPPRWKR